MTEGQDSGTAGVRLRRLLAATDLSSRSDRALRRAAMLAQQAGAELVLLHVVDGDQPRSMVEAERREAARAAHDALPLLAAMEEVTVLTISPEQVPDGHGEQPGADIATHLARHGLNVTVRSVPGADVAVGEVLLNEAADLGAGLLVMGGYGHSRLREFVLGGATRTLLAEMTLPVLMSH